MSLAGNSCHVLYGLVPKPAHNVHFLHSWVIGWELVSCALGAWCRNRKVYRVQSQLTVFSQCTFSLFLCHWLEQCIIFPFPCHWLRAHVMCSGDLVLKPQGEPGTKPAHNAYFLHPWDIGWELMSGALAAWCRKHQVNPGQNQLTMHIFCIPGHWLGAHVMCSGPNRNHNVKR